MVIVTLLYPREDGATFDFDYYEKTHLPLVAERWRNAGFRGSQALRGLAGADGGPSPHLAVALLLFESPEAFNAAMSREETADILADVANYTNVRPVVQVNDILWDTRV